MVIFDKKKCNFLSKKMLTNELWFVIINELSQVSDNKPLQNEAKQNKKVVWTTYLSILFMVKYKKAWAEYLPQ